MPTTIPECILLSGASGLIGNLILRRLLMQAAAHVIAPSRRSLDISGPNLSVPLGDWSNPATRATLLAQLQRQGPVNAWVCTLGTTLKVAGSKAAFRAVDLDLVLRMGELARAAGAGRAIVVSSVGARADSRNFYLAVKGEAERGLQGLGFARLDLLRPGLLMGARAAQRGGEAWAQRLAPLFNPLLVGALRRFRAIGAEVVAAKAVQLLGQAGDGCHVHEYDRLNG